MNRWINEIGGRIDKWTDRWMEGWLGRCMEGWIDEQMDRQMGRWMDRWTNRCYIRRQLPLDCYGAQGTYFSCLMESMVL